MRFNDPPGIDQVLELTQNFIEAKMQPIGPKPDFDNLETNRIRRRVLRGAQDAGANEGAAFGGLLAFSRGRHADLGREVEG